MAVKNNPTLGYLVCRVCTQRASVHQCERGKGRFLYTRGCACGTDQRTGAPVQSAIWHGAEWIPGLKPAVMPPGVVELQNSSVNPGSDPVPEPEPAPVLDAVPEPGPEPDFVPPDPVEEDRGGIWWLLGGALALVAAVARGYGMAELNPQVENDLSAMAAQAANDYVPEAGAAAPKPALDTMSTRDLCILLIGLSFSAMAARRGEHWNLSQDETDKLGGATAAVLDKYLPNMNAGPEAALVLAAVVIVTPRIMQDRAKQAEAVPGGSQPGHE